jgi:predicted amidohydrolase YtcJ
MTTREVPITDTYKKPKGVGVVQKPTGLVLENNAMLLKAALKAEMDHLENQARDTVDPAERQQLLRRFCEKRTEYFSV